MKDPLKKKKLIKISVFTTVLCSVLYIAGLFFRPVYLSWNNYDTIHGFYEQPDNTIETVFLGASVTARGFIPMQLYDDTGICSYNLGMEDQPMMASYYWLKECHSYHPDTLKNVILDTSMLRRNPEEAAFRKAFDQMHYGEVKKEAIGDLTDDLNGYLNYMIPLLSFHDRWKSLEKSDIKKFTLSANTCSRGYDLLFGKYINTTLSSDIAAPLYYPDDTVTPFTPNKTSLDYLEKINGYCNDNGLKLILVRTCCLRDWGSDKYNGVSAIADELGVPYVDFNCEPFLSETDFNFATDTTDGEHLNYYGASKQTGYIGSYLLENCTCTDIRNKEGYSFMSKESEESGNHYLYPALLDKINLYEDYMNAASKSGYTVSSNSDPSGSITVTIYDDRLDKKIQTAVFPSESDERISGDLNSELKKALSTGTDPEELPPVLKDLFLYNEYCETERQLAFRRAEGGGK